MHHVTELHGGLVENVYIFTGKNSEHDAREHLFKLCKENDVEPIGDAYYGDGNFNAVMGYALPQ